MLPPHHRQSRVSTVLPAPPRRRRQRLRHYLALLDPVIHNLPPVLV